jgi:hypothetical protein
MTTDEFTSRQLEHAKWRVEFLASLLPSHRLLQVAEPEWEGQDADRIERMEAAKEELKRAERMFLTRALEHA